MRKTVLFSVVSCIQSFRGVGVCVGEELGAEKGGETSLFG